MLLITCNIFVEIPLGPVALEMLSLLINNRTSLGSHGSNTSFHFGDYLKICQKILEWVFYLSLGYYQQFPQNNH